MGTVPRLVLTRERTVRTYAEMWHSSRCLLDAGIENPEGSDHQFRASLVFTAFTLEAYLNHVGPHLFDCWQDLEYLRPRAKLNLICERLHVQTNYARRPWQVMQRLFQFRNDVAHGRSEIVRTRQVIPAHKYDQAQISDFAPTKWERYATESNAGRARDDVEAIIRTIHAAGAFKPAEPFMLGPQFGSAEPEGT